MWQNNKVGCAGLVQCQLQLTRAASNVCNIQRQRVGRHIVQSVDQQIRECQLQFKAG
jgi:hypothetical protein